MDAFFRRLFPKESWNAYEAYHREVGAHLPAEGMVLDLGCGVNTDLAGYRTCRRQVWGVDLQAHPQLEHRPWFRRMDRDHIPFADGTFDVAASRWVLEHIPNPVTFLHEIARVLRPGGVFVSLTVNGAHYVSWLNRLVGLFPHGLTQRLVQRLYGRAHHDTFATYYRMNSWTGLSRACRAAGLRLGRITPIANFGYFSFAKPVACAAMAIDRCLEVIWPGWGRIYWVVPITKPSHALETPLAA